VRVGIVKYGALHELWRCLIIIIVVVWNATHTFLYARKSAIIYRYNAIVCFGLLNTKYQPRDRRTTQSLNTIISQCPSLIARLNYTLLYYVLRLPLERIDYRA